MVCVVCCKCSQKKEVFLIWVVDLVRAVETGGRGGGTRVDVVLGLILKCFVGGLIDEGVNGTNKDAWELFAGRSLQLYRKILPPSDLEGRCNKSWGEL